MNAQSPNGPCGQTPSQTPTSSSQEQSTLVRLKDEQAEGLLWRRLTETVAIFGPAVLQGLGLLGASRVLRG